MSIFFIYIAEYLVFTKTLIFKNLVSKILFFASVLFFLSSFNRPYPHPEYYTFETSDGVIHKWSREVYFDYYGTIEETTNEVYLKYDKMSHFEIDHTAILIVSQEKRALNKIRENEIMWKVHPNFKPTLDKYCVNENSY